MAIELQDYNKNKCAENGGVSEIYLYQLCDRESFTLSPEGVVTGITLKSGTTAVRWTPDIESSVFTDDGARQRENNSYMVSQTGMIMLKDDDDSTRESVEDASRGFLGVIVKKANPAGVNQFIHFGFVNGMVAETTNGTTGQNFEDMRGHTVNFMGKELGLAPTVDASVIPTIYTAS